MWMWEIILFQFLAVLKIFILLTVSSDQLLSNCDTLNLMTLDLWLVSKNITTSLPYTG